MHALIIEDEFLTAATIEFVLRDCGFDSFDFATSSGVAIAAARSRRPDLVTADIQLEPGSGIDAVRAICATAPVPVIYITVSARNVREQLQNHAVLDKPFSPETLSYAVAACLPS